MDLLQLKYFAALAKKQHINATAQEMMVTPSAVSSSLARLEKEMGLKLFDRVGRNIRLNGYGKVFSKYVDQVFTALGNAEAELQEMKSMSGQTISVAITNPNLWNKPLREFYAMYPDIPVSLIAFDTGGNPNAGQPANSRLEEADFYIATSGTVIDENQEFESQTLFQSEVLLAVSPGHRFAGRMSIDLAEAKDEWFVNSPSNTSFRRFCDHLCQEAGFTAKSRIECDYVLRPRMLINENMVCIATSLGKHSGFYDDVIMIPIINPPCTRPQAIYWRAHSYQSKSAQIFKEFLVEYCKKW